MEKEYRICTKTVMDTSDPDIFFDEQGISNHYYDYYTKLNARLESENGEEKLQKIIEKIKEAGKGNEYDCIVGVSGGTDSTYVAYKCKELGLRPLAVHFDNGWNSELAVSNIEKVLKKLGIELYTYVIDWEEFRELQISYLKSATPDVEIPTDHAIFALLYQIAVKYNIKYIMNGMNFRTESIMPHAWAYGHIDWKYIRSVHRVFSKGSLKRYPHFSFYKLLYYTFARKIQFISILNYIEFNKTEAQKTLAEQLGWQNYGGKHHESVYTRIVQSYYLPHKFNIDKRRAHLSNLILSGQITREDALEELKHPPYDPQTIGNDIEYLTKKLKMSKNEFDQILQAKNKTFRDYPNAFGIFKLAKSIQQYLRKKNFLHK